MNGLKNTNGKIMAKAIIGWAVLVAAIFLPAGTLNWPEAWLFLLIYFAFSFPALIWLKKNNPELLRERMSFKMPVKRWDKVIMLSLPVLFVAQVIILGLDAVRYEWSQIPFTIKAAGFVGLILSFILIFLPMKENPYLTKIVVVQKDQKVITTGPYKYVRHPMYSGVIILFFSLPLAIGSLYALIPGTLITILLIIRTWFEDKMLNEELPGYKEYVRKTRYRLLPWVW